MSGKRPTGRRWVCPSCGDGCIAPERPRADDVRRYCLPCSARTGRLVKRTCPALDRQRDARASARAERAAKEAAARAEARAAERERAREQRERDARRTAAVHVARRTAAGEDLHAMAVRLWALPCLRDARAKRHSRFHALPAIEVGRRGPRSRGTAEFSPGHYDSIGHAVRVTIGTDEYGAWETLAHELTHAALGNPGDGWHGRRFWNLVRAVAAEAWPEIGWRFVDAPERGYRLDQWIGDRLRDHYAPAAG